MTGIKVFVVLIVVASAITVYASNENKDQQEVEYRETVNYVLNNYENYLKNYKITIKNNEVVNKAIKEILENPNLKEAIKAVNDFKKSVTFGVTNNNRL